ncbi:hypothetical protein [Kangiella taiwanensis]|uniref:hypothetical protein n=1 Tax=Kangiella taiwanensis TaxID=1079179 RepID=UPI001CC13CD5|nr:hypothetical protein [Kangiella taiwanensis]
MISVERWLKLIAVIHIIGGVILPFMVFTPLATSYFEHLLNAFPDSDIESLRFLVGVFGPTVASWGLLFYCAVGKAFQSKTPRDWWLLFAAVMVWLVFDTTFSLFFNITTHLYINGLVAIIILLPLLKLKAHFQGKGSNDAS